MTRREKLRLTVSALLIGATGTAETPAPDRDERSFRYRIETVDSLFQRAQAALADRAISADVHRAFIELLQEEASAIAREAAAWRFKDISESNYWHRGSLKFPSALQTESRRLRNAQ